MLKYTEMSITHYEEAHQLWEKAEGVYLTNADSKKSIKKYLERNPGMSFVCIEEKEKKMVGALLCGNDGRRGIIYHLVVHPTFRNRSVGKTLTQLSLKKLKEAGIERCFALVRVDNKTGNEFWSKTGWNKKPESGLYLINL